MKLSILILTHNRLATSIKCIINILNNIGNIDSEVLIWDNCSDDGTLDWLCDFEKIDNRIKIFGSEVNLGVEAINNLAEEATGTYLLKVDDDIWVPKRFAERLVSAYEESKEPKLGFLAFDMFWNKKTFATRSGLTLYKEPKGKTITLKSSEKVYINYRPSKWMINGACRLCKKDFFKQIGGHPRGIFYGVDHKVSIATEKLGYYIGYYHTDDPVNHIGGVDPPMLRAKKNKELHRIGAPLHV